MAKIVNIFLLFAFLYAAIHLMIIASIVLEYAMLDGVVLMIFGLLVLVSVIFGSKAIIGNKLLPFRIGILLNLFLLLLGIAVIGVGFFNKGILPTGYYVGYRQLSHLYISFGAGVFLISLGTMIFVLVRQMFRKE